ncbi:hypothetical protein BN14_10919 [Rhizoctonia solani AG-1 IB]|uniref:Calcineurin-like phosphoesterase domain-containing protein n=1 Tax=Thanatephorus cucumeris (strain AG1-IB / isolate 7/3/14) TaxID=1108050 RepID=M5CCD1_THACB|nr:hypothetical protein BN14_10919 [Rhizoctonia solani AG-1 IB]
MKAILLGILAGFATAKEIINHEDPTINIPVPTQPLEWGDVNVLHTTDLHGWVSGHSKEVYPKKSWR